MKLRRIHLKGFRCFENLTLDLGDRVTVIIAGNGIGKTALLDAIALGYGRYLTGIPGIQGRTLKDSDLRVTSGEKREPFAMLGWEAENIDGVQLEWSSVRRRDQYVSNQFIKARLSEKQNEIFSRGAKDIDEFSRHIAEKNSDDEAYFLPVVVYYGTNRTIRDEVQRRRGFKKVFSRFDALKDALEPDCSFRSAFEWFNAMEDLERREKEARRDFDYALEALDAVRSSIEKLLPGFRRPRTETSPLRFVIDQLMPDGSVRTLRISQLSDGYRAVLGVTMDLARRMVEANIGLRPETLKDTPALDLPAIVLIDEVDLHLHPEWQQRIVGDLVRVFPNAQFVLTTHSPQVLSTVKREDIRVIGVDASGMVAALPPLAMTYGEPSGDVLQSVMHVDPQPPVIEKGDLLHLTELVDQGEYQTEEASELLKSLEKSLGKFHPQLQILKRSIERQEFLKK